jgi:hypothetical protein
MLAWVAIFIPTTPLLVVHGYWLAFSLFVLAMSAGLIAVCYVKGEPPRWRWGGN